MTESRIEAGTVVAGRYRVEGVLGEGGMGTVYLARRIDLPMDVALKTLRPERAADPEFVARFLREGEALAKMRHPHVVDVLDVGTHAGTAFLVMARLEGQTLAERLCVLGPLPQTALVDLIVPVLAALSTAHARGIVHRDLKPENIFIERTPNGLLHPRLVDFGIARLGAPLDGQRLTQSDRVVGTPLYMAPEQARQARDVGPAADQYALGVTLYECASGRSPFTEQTLSGVLLAAAEGRAQPLQTVAPRLDPAFCAVVHRAMHPRPSERFADVDALARALLPFASPAVRSLWAPAFGDDLGVTLEAPTVPRPGPARAVATAPTDAARDAAAEAPTLPRPLAPRSARTRRPLVFVALVGAGALSALVLGRSTPPDRTTPTVTAVSTDDPPSPGAATPPLTAQVDAGAAETAPADAATPAVTPRDDAATAPPEAIAPSSPPSVVFAPRGHWVLPHPSRPRLTPSASRAGAEPSPTPPQGANGAPIVP